MVKYILFDLDNTLYPKSSGLDQEVGRRMADFTAAFLGVPREEAQRLRATEAIPFGTTLKWLIGSRGLSPAGVEAFLKAVHPEDLAPYFPPNPELRTVLEEIRLPKAVLTNSPAEHAERVLRRLGIDGQFAGIFDLRYSDFLGKPEKTTYLKVFAELGLRAEEVLLVDDMPRNLYPCRELGGEVLLVDEDGIYAEAGLPFIRGILELRNSLKQYAKGHIQ